MGYGDGVKGFRVQSQSKRKAILSRDVVFDKLFMLNSIFDEYLGKDKDVTKLVEFESSTIRKISDQKQIEGPDETNQADETDQDLQMHP